MSKPHTPRLPPGIWEDPEALAGHAVIIRDFLCCLFRPDEQVHICALAGDERYGHLLGHPEEMPPVQDGNLARLPRRMMVFSRKAGSLRTRALRDLHRLNLAGWDIFFCINPLTCGRRCQRTVRKVRHILLESDTAPLERQRDLLLNVFGHGLSAVQYTGGRSIHGYLRLAGEIWNPSRVGWGMARRLDDTACSIPEYTRVADAWIRTMTAWGMEPDPCVVRDFARLSRLPGFLHSGTGVVSTVEMLNPSCPGWRMTTDPLDDDDGAEPTFGEWEAGLEGMEQSLQACLTGVPEVTALVDSCSSSGSGSSSSSSPVSPTSADHPLGMNIVCEKDITARPCGSFLDDLEVFGRLRACGIPERHRRRELHRKLFTAARVFGWGGDRMASEWRGIVSILPGSIGEAVDDAVSDMLRHWDAVRTGAGRVYLPDLGRLPVMTRARERHMEESLSGMGCPAPRNAALILSRVVWPKLGQAAGQCLGGAVNLHAAAMRDACPDRRYRAALEWLKGNGTVGCTNPRYLHGVRTRTYRVNVPMLLWLAGFRTADMVWGKARAGEGRRRGGASA